MQTGSKVVPTTFKRPSRPVLIESNTEDTTDKAIYKVTRPMPAVVPNRRWPPPRPEPEPEEQQYRPPPTPARTPAPVVAGDSQFSSNEGCGKARKEVALIWHGHSYSPGEWPWLVAIYQTGARQLNFVCSGTLVSDRHVITAAHCMQNKEASDIVVKLGVFNLEEWGGDVVVKKLQSAVVHEQFNKTNLANDISLFTLEQSVQFNTNIKPICLWGTNTDLNRIVGHTGVVTGWGDNEFGRGGHGDPRMIRMPIVSTDDCRASTPDLYKLTSDRTLCAGNRDGTGPCSGDSGGGLYVIDDGRWKLRGIVSLALSSKSAEKRCNLDEYVVFTDAAKYTRNELQLLGTLNGGQSFRWTYDKESDVWTGIFNKTVWKLRQTEDILHYQVLGTLESNQNNHISRISSMVEKLCTFYGEKICEHDGVKYYSFPEVEMLAIPQVESKLRDLGFGYRAKFIQKSAAQIVEWGGITWFDSLQEMKYKDARQELMKLCGIGPKVADCICLMSLNHLEALPVDTHVYQIAAQNYLPHLKGKKNVTDKIYAEIGDHFRNLYGELAGWAHTVLFCADLKKFQNTENSDGVQNDKPRKKRRHK
ncbi:unnamed protein product, partial [Iphiclides podalirius]